jgi:hypothetical protein
MKVEELRRDLDDASRRDIDVVEARAAVGEKTARRRRRNHQLVGVVTVIVIAAIAIPIAMLRHDPKATVRVGPQPSETVDGWTQIRKTTAGLPSGSSFSTIASTDDSLLLGGTASANGDQAAIWYSDDGLTWRTATIPFTKAPGVQAIATNGQTALAIGADNLGQSPFVWRSDDDGRTWNPVADGEIFGASAPQMGRPFVDGLIYAHDKWIASGGASSGYAGVWTSANGTQWTQVLDTRPGPPDTGVGGVKVVVDATNGHLVAYGGNVTWKSSDGTSWGEPVVATVPEPYLLQTVAPGATISFGDNKLKHGQPTPLLLGAVDRADTWVADPTFLEQFPDARVLNVTRAEDLFVASGWSSTPNHPDAWISADGGSSWQSLPPSLYGTPGGTLSMAGSVDGRVVLFGTAPELGRYYTFERPL